MTVAKDDSLQMRTYGGWTRPVSAGIGKLGTIGSAVLVAGFMLVAITFPVSRWAGLVVLLVLLVSLTPFVIRTRDRQSGWEVLGNRIGWLVTKITKQHAFRCGPLSPVGRFALPGLAAATELHSAVDAHGVAYALISHPKLGHVSVVFASEPEGTDLYDQGDIDHRIARFGQTLGGLGVDRDLVGATITIDSAPDWGHKLRNEITSQIRDDAHPLARSVLMEIADTYPEGSSTLRSYVTLTWRRSRPRLRKQRTIEEMAAEIGRRLPSIRTDLSETGAGVPTLLVAGDLAGIVRAAFDPKKASDIDNSSQTATEWTNAGPVSADESPTTYYHDSGMSRSWYMASPPRGDVPSTVLTALLKDNALIARKRVTFIYRPYDPATATDRVDHAVRNRSFNLGGKRRAGARDYVDLAAVERSAFEEARGAGLVRLAMIVTATVLEGHNLEDAADAAESAARASRIDLRVARRQQSNAFLAGLPLGIMLSHHTRMLRSFRELNQ